MRNALGIESHAPNSRLRRRVIARIHRILQQKRGFAFRRVGLGRDGDRRSNQNAIGPRLGDHEDALAQAELPAKHSWNDQRAALSDARSLRSLHVASECQIFRHSEYHRLVVPRQGPGVAQPPVSRLTWMRAAIPSPPIPSVVARIATPTPGIAARPSENRKPDRSALDGYSCPVVSASNPASLVWRSYLPESQTPTRSPLAVPGGRLSLRCRAARCSAAHRRR